MNETTNTPDAAKAAAAIAQVVELLRPMVQKIEASLPTTRNHYGTYMTILGQAQGEQYSPRYEDDPGNHRIRTEFINPAGNRYFLEVGTGTGPDNMRIDYAIDRTKQDELKDDIDQQSKFYNFHRLETSKNFGRYTKRDIINLVNREFNCHFQEMEVDNYTLSTDDFICKSPRI